MTYVPTKEEIDNMSDDERLEELKRCVSEYALSAAIAGGGPLVTLLRRWTDRTNTKFILKIIVSPHDDELGIIGGIAAAAPEHRIVN